MNQERNEISTKAMLNAYPDSIGGALSGIVSMLQEEQVKNAFGSFYILPSFFNTDLDRGFSVIDYGMNENYVSQQDLDALKKEQVDLKLDFILNHLSVLSTQFQDIVKKGERSEYKDFFINWNTFWQGHGTMTEHGYIQPEEEYIKKMFFRKPGLPILMVRTPDGEEIPYWNTFYQEVQYRELNIQDLVTSLGLQYVTAQRVAELINGQLREGKQPQEMEFGCYTAYRDDIIEYMEQHRCYLGQMDVNIESDQVWEFYDNTLRKLAEYGAKIVRLDAFAYAPKKVGEHNFMNEPGTWELLSKVQKVADRYNLTLLPEIHTSYSERIFETLSDKGYMSYDFFLPGLIIDALESGDGGRLARWAMEQKEKKIRTVNMLGCHDGIPMLDLKGLLPDERIEELIEIIVSRGGMIKNLHGAKNIYYQVNATYFSALGESEEKMLLARALQLFMPGKPQVWYLDLFMGKNDYEAVRIAGPSGHKEINRTNLTCEEVVCGLEQSTTQKQLKLLQFRNSCEAFGWDSLLTLKVNEKDIEFIWQNDGCSAILRANLGTYEFQVVEVRDGRETVVM